ARSKVKFIMIGATNRPQHVDPAVARRFDNSLLVGPPDQYDRQDIFRCILRDQYKVEGSIDYHEAALKSDGFAASDIANVCRAASQIPLKEAWKAWRKKQHMSNKSGNVTVEIIPEQMDVRPIQNSVSGSRNEASPCI